MLKRAAILAATFSVTPRDFGIFSSPSLRASRACVHSHDAKQSRFGGNGFRTWIASLRSQ